jgi:hypothetical protein
VDSTPPRSRPPFTPRPFTAPRPTPPASDRRVAARRDFEALAPARPRPRQAARPAARPLDRTPNDPVGERVPLDVDYDELVARLADVDEASSLTFMLEALRTVNSPLRLNTSFSEDRRTKLLQAGGGAKLTGADTHLVDQMGLRTARSLAPGPVRFGAFSQKSTSYLRTNPDELNVLFAKVFPRADPADVVVNSPMVLPRLKRILEERLFTQLTLEPHPFVRGLCLLKVPSTWVVGDRLRLRTLLHDIGAAPSPYQALKCVDVIRKGAPLQPTRNGAAKVRTLLESGSFRRVRELTRPTALCPALYGPFVHLLEGLGSLADGALKRVDPLVENALDSLADLLRVAVFSEKETATLIAALDLMMDELAVILGATTPYTRAHFREAVTALEDTRSPALAALLRQKDCQRELYYATSGMDALSTALTIALDSSGGPVDRPSQRLDYYELDDLLGNLNKGTPISIMSGVIVAALHPSTPYEGQNIKALIRAIEERLAAHSQQPRQGPDPTPPMALVLDTTIETGGSELNDLWAALGMHVERGALNVFTCKSYHKYATLGTGKLSAGVVSLVGRRLTHGFIRPKTLMRLHEDNLDFASSPDAQLMTHILRHAAGDELSLIRSAAANAAFVDAECWPPGRHPMDLKFVIGIPLLFRAMEGGNVRELVKLLNIDTRDSFSFLRTSHVGFILQGAECVRLNPGQESKPAMVEFFYALGHLVTGRRPGQVDAGNKPGEVSVPAILEHLAHLAARVEEDVQTGSPLRYANNIRASYLFLAARLLSSRPADDHDGRVRDQLAECLDSGMADVTRDMQSLLARDYIERCCAVWPIDEKPPQLNVRKQLLTRLLQAARLAPREDGERLAAMLPALLTREERAPLAAALTLVPRVSGKLIAEQFRQDARDDQ